MGFKEVLSLDCDTTISLGGEDKKTKKPNPTKIEGYYIGTKEVGPNKFNKNKQDVVHVFQTKEGNTGVWGKTDLDTKLKNTVPGRMVRVTFTGTIPTNKGNDMLKFKVEIDDSNTIDVSDLAGTTDNTYSDDVSEEDEEVEETEDEEAKEPSRVAPAVAATAVERANRVKELLSKSKKVG